MNSNIKIPKSILFVCLGNICRSPMAKAVFDYVSTTEGNHKSSYSTTSAGTASYHLGDDADQRTLTVCKQNQVPIHHLAQQIQIKHWESANLIFGMDKENVIALRRIIPEVFHHKIYLIGDFDPVTPGADVPDPYYGSIHDFEKVFEQLHRISKNLIIGWQSK